MNAILYKFVPDTQIAWRDVWVGSVTTALLFQIGQIAIGLYLTHSAVASAYGAAGAMVVTAPSRLVEKGWKMMAP